MGTNLQPWCCEFTNIFMDSSTVTAWLLSELKKALSSLFEFTLYPGLILFKKVKLVLLLKHELIDYDAHWMKPCCDPVTLQLG